jgi:folate-binding protein YgfZ
VCNLQGKVLGHLAVFCTEASLWIDSVPGQEENLFAHLDRYLINEHVQIERRTSEFGELYLTGETATQSLQSIFGASISALASEPVMSHVTLDFRSNEAQVRLVDWLSEPGYLISARRADLPELEQRLIDAGEELADASVWNALRIEAGFPWYGIDLTADNLAQEANRTARCISFHKGCYLGQEPIARIDALGHVNRELRRLTISGNEAPPAGTRLIDAATKAQVGVITSAAESARRPGTVVALGYLRTSFLKHRESSVALAASGSAIVTIH